MSCNARWNGYWCCVYFMMLMGNLWEEPHKCLYHMSMANLWSSMVLHPPLLCFSSTLVRADFHAWRMDCYFPTESSADLVCVPGKTSLPFWIICFIDIPLTVKCLQTSVEFLTVLRRTLNAFSGYLPIPTDAYNISKYVRKKEIKKKEKENHIPLSISWVLFLKINL